MKKIIFITLSLLYIPIIYAEEIEVKFSNCVDGDTAKFIYNNDEITARFLAIDTPETVHPTKEDELFGKEASDYTCNSLKYAKKIILEYDEESDKTDKYNRHLVWVFIDGNLLQENIVRNGLAKVEYLYGDYKYTNRVKNAEQLAKEDKLGIWNNNDVTKVETMETMNNQKKNTNDTSKLIEEYKEYIILIGALIIVSIFNLKSKRKIKTKLKNKIKKDIKKRLK